MGKNQLKKSTYVKYTTILERHIKPKLGKCDPMSMTSELVDAFSYELLYVDNLSPKTVKDILVVLRSIIKYTEKLAPGTLPVIEIVYPKEKKKEMRVLSLEEQNVLIRYLTKDMDNCKFGILLALFTGLRIGELCALKWNAVSVEKKTIRISSTMQRLQNLEDTGETKTRVIIDTPKSESSARTIPMTDYAADICRKMKPSHEDVYVLTGNMHYVEPRTLQYRFNKYIEECGLTDVHFHTLRHTFATRCVEVGFEIKSLSEILGHSTTTITLERYVHSSMELKRNNMNKLTAFEL